MTRMLLIRVTHGLSDMCEHESRSFQVKMPRTSELISTPSLPLGFRTL